MPPFADRLRPAARGLQLEPEVEAKNAIGRRSRREGRARRAAPTRFLRPGKWLTKATLEELSAPGMPPEIADNMKAMMAEQAGHRDIA